MYIEQIYTNCLAEAAYYIESNGEAVIIDPLRETGPYIKKAEENGAKIKDCFIDDNNSLYFVVQEGEFGKAIGKNGVKAKSM